MKNKVIVLSFIPFICFLIGYFLPLYVCSVSTIQTPSILGLTLNQAIPLLSQMQLNIRILTKKIETDLPDGTILTQSPTVGSLIKPNQSLYCVISSKPPFDKAPNAIDLTEKEIRNLLKKTKIRPKFYHITSSFPKYRCIGQLPQPGEDVTEKNIIFYLSAGSNKRYILPQFIGKPLPEVVEFLDSYNIKVSVIGNKIHNENSSVIDQRPLAGTMICLENKCTIELQVS